MVVYMVGPSEKLVKVWSPCWGVLVEFNHGRVHSGSIGKLTRELDYFLEDLQNSNALCNGAVASVHKYCFRIRRTNIGKLIPYGILQTGLYKQYFTSGNVHKYCELLVLWLKWYSTNMLQIITFTIKAVLYKYFVNCYKLFYSNMLQIVTFTIKMVLYKYVENC